MTGGSGFLGGHVIPRLLQAGHDVTALARSPVAAERVATLGAEPIGGDLDDPASIDAVFCGCGAEGLVNLASLGFGHAPAIVSAAEEAGMERAVFVSTTSIHTRLPTSSKPARIAAEETVRASGLAWTIIRPTMIYGAPGDRNMARLLRLARRTPLIPLPGGGTGLQQPVHVEDLAAVIVTALTSPASVGRCYDIAGPEPLTLRSVVEEAAAAVGRRPKLLAVPLVPMVRVASAYQRAAPSPRLTAEQVQRLAEDKAVDIGPAVADLGYAPRSFADGIRAQAAALA